MQKWETTGQGIAGSIGYDLTRVQAIVIPAHGKILIKIGILFAISLAYYGRMFPLSGLALKESIDKGSGVIDSDY